MIETCGERQVRRSERLFSPAFSRERYAPVMMCFFCFFFFLVRCFVLFFFLLTFFLPLPLNLTSSRPNDATRYDRLARRRHGLDLLIYVDSHAARDARVKAAVSQSKTSSISSSRRRRRSFFVFVASSTTTPSPLLKSTRRPRRGFIRLPFPVPLQGMGRRTHRRQAHGREHQGTLAGDQEGVVGGGCEYFLVCSIWFGRVLVFLFSLLVLRFLFNQSRM